MKAGWIIDQLICQGVEHFCIAPGSRSSPLALAVANHPKAKVTVHFDERGLGFFALGIGKATKTPAAVITTSGTAVANLYPSVMEASQSMTPMILLTADRPHELRFCGSNQTMDQVRIFANAVREQVDLSPHIDEKTTRSMIAQNVFSSLKNPPGPVHMNCPFQDPLHTEVPLREGGKIEHSFPTLSAKPLKVDANKGVILLGPISEDPAPVLKLARRLQWPVFADLLSNARQTPTPEQIRSFDWILQSGAPKPDFILHFGNRFISKRILEWEKEVPMTHVSPFPFLQDPARRLSMRIQSDIEPFCEMFEAKTDPTWLFSWQELDQKLEPEFSHPFTEAHAVRSLPSDRPIFFGNSMPIRLADHFFFPKKAPQVFANRGVSGIDGNIATIAGIAEGLNSPSIGFIGDQTALHDLNSLPLIKKHKILLIISNNFGGGIFDYLPISKSRHLERFFTASHPWTFENVAKMFDIPYVRVEGMLDDLPSFGIVELMTKREESYAFLQRCKERCKRSLREPEKAHGSLLQS